MFRKLRRRLFRFVVVSGAGAAAEYFFDRDRGDARRAQAREKAESLLGRRKAETPASSSYGSSFSDGQAYRSPVSAVPPPVEAEVVPGVEQALAGPEDTVVDVTVDTMPDVVGSSDPVVSRDR